ncbi:D-tagatose-bisphosphate aldolase, class II, non-catalytic subunit [Candidatus Neomarinimicrobiota bacterium]
MADNLQRIISGHKEGTGKGIYSICSANMYALEAAIQQALADDSPVLIEATSNQVDQFGGYIGMTPEQFSTFVYNIAEKAGLPRDRIILGGDHLGPNVWQNEAASEAMGKAHDQIQAYVSAGFTKIHLDASMRLVDDPGHPGTPLDVELIARRAAEMCQTAERAADKLSPGAQRPCYVIGTDVPTPGGATDDAGVHVTPVNEVSDTIGANERVFKQLGLEQAWERVLAVVVQPGVEFGDSSVYKYAKEKASGLSDLIAAHPQLVFEAHSTDYQTEAALTSMVEDHFAILKVGPWLTFAMREAVFALDGIERELAGPNSEGSLMHLPDVMEKVMLEQPQHWHKHYSGTPEDQRLARKFSYSDRIRYYWPDPAVKDALHCLLKNLGSREIPDTLLSQYLPNQYEAVVSGTIRKTPTELIRHRIMEVTGKYARSCGQGNPAQR